MRSRLDALLDKLNVPARRALEAATSTALLRGQPEVAPEHWLQAILQAPHETDAVRCARYFGSTASAWVRRLHDSVIASGHGIAGRPRLSLDLQAALSEAWAIASLDDATAAIRTGHVLLAVAAVKPDSLDLPGLDRARLRTEFASWTAGSVESIAAPEGDKRDALNRFTLDLTAAARDGRLDAVVGREEPTRELIQILSRRRQNNPLLLGDAGVGKTAIVEGLALRIAAGEVPERLQRASLRSLDLAALQAGAAAVGELESRIQQLLSEVAASSDPILLFLDEAHTVFQLGAAVGALDVVNLLKPALARGELRLIAATTHAEFKRHFERDAAFARRFQIIRIEEPSEDEAVWMLRGVAPKLAAHHGIPIESGALRSAVRLSQRYLAGRQLPDKAIGLLDTAAARVALTRVADPAIVDDLRAEVARLETEAAAFDNEELAVAETRLADAERQAEEERALVRQIEQTEFEGQAANPLRQELAALQGDRPLVPESVNERVLAEVVAAWTGIPVSRILGSERESVLNLRARLGERIAGQDHALEAIVKRILAARAGLEDESRPLGVFLLTGPTGSGKSETPRALADVLYSGERDLITVPLSEYQEAHSISGLRGAPPGYVGYGESGMLTEALRRRPYSVLLLDEIEKAHPDIREFLYEMLDQGRLEDATGRRIDVRHSIVFLTSNLGAETIEGACAGRMIPPPEVLSARVESELRQVLRPAFLGRVTVVPYYPLTFDALRRIADWRLAKIAARLKERHRMVLVIEEDVADAIASASEGGEGGARSIDRLLAETLRADLSRQIVSGSLRPGSRVTVSVRPDGGGRAGLRLHLRGEP